MCVCVCVCVCVCTCIMHTQNASTRPAPSTELNFLLWVHFLAELLWIREPISSTQFTFQLITSALFKTFSDLQAPGRPQSTMHVCVCVCVCANSLQSCPALCNSKDCSPQGSSVHGILQAKILEWVTMFSSSGSFWPGDRTLTCTGRKALYHWRHLGSHRA